MRQFTRAMFFPVGHRGLGGDHSLLITWLSLLLYAQSVERAFDSSPRKVTRARWWGDVASPEGAGEKCPQLLGEPLIGTAAVLWY